jgi:hypothetical protein
VVVASGGDFCGSVCAKAVAAVSTPRRVRHVRGRIQHERRKRGYCPTGSCPGSQALRKRPRENQRNAIIIRTSKPAGDIIP